MPSTILDRSDRSTDREALHRDPNLVLYRTRAGFTAVTQLTSSEGQVDQRFFDVNAPGRDLLALVDGHRSLADIATEYCRSTDLDVDPNRSWIDDYFTVVRERGVVFAGEPHDDPALKEIGHGGLLRPVHLTVEITDACNLECQHCYLEASPAKQARMTFAEFQRVVGAFQENQGLSIELTGGEVVCNPEWKPILELALEQFSLVGLLTNATVLPADALQLLTRYADRVTVGVSIDSVRPELHDRLRGRRHAFERTIRNVRRLVATGVRVRVGSVIFDENMWEVRELAHLAVDLGAAMFSFNYVEDFGRGHDPGAALEPLRSAGEAYAAVGRYVYDLGILVTAALFPYSAALEERTQRLLGELRPSRAHLDAARRAFAFQLRLALSASQVHALAPYALVDPTVTVADLDRLVDDIGLDEIEALLASGPSLFRKVVDQGVV